MAEQPVDDSMAPLMSMVMAVLMLSILPSMLQGSTTPSPPLPSDPPIPPPPTTPLLANLYGVVTDSQSGDPISGVSVTVNGSIAITDNIGYY
ncbi:hypothetical protein LCGC14_2954010, partial [marine sediment metagenome]